MTGVVARWDTLLLALAGACGTLYEHVHSRYVLAALDAITTSGIAPISAANDGMGHVVIGTRRYNRVRRLATTVSRLGPSAFDRCLDVLIDPARLPLTPVDVRLLDFGSGATVYLVQRRSNGNDDARVVKIYRQSLGRRVESLIGLARTRLGHFRRVSSWYEGSSMLLPTHFVILHGPLLSRPAVACVQPYVPGPHVDVFNDLSESALVRLLEEHASLKAQFRRFVEQTQDAAARDRACVDLIGRKNLIVIGTGDQPRLLLLEHGTHDLEYIRQRAPQRFDELTRRLRYLQRVHGHLTS